MGRGTPQRSSRKKLEQAGLLHRYQWHEDDQPPAQL